MAIFDNSNAEGPAGDPAEQGEAVAAQPSSPQESRTDEITPEAITTARPSSAQAVAAPARSAASNLPAALEPELRRIIDTAVARVAAIELEAIREARELTQRSEQEARDALRFALDRAFNLINSLELLAATVNGMAEALKVELDDAITALRNVPEPESALSRELAQQPEPVAPAVESPAPEPAAAAEPEPEAVAAAEPEAVAAAEPEPEPEAAAAAEPEQPEPAAAAEPEPAPEPEPQPEPAAAEPEPAPEQPAEPRVKLAPLVRPAEAARPEGAPAKEAPAEAAPEPELVTAGAPAPEPAPTPPPRKAGRVRRFFTR